ncbi:hypothetical protein BP1258A_5507 [Burkholderia pseudomallei 1258a]|nr:hypothetical protein BP1258A_5507 [Burkholderia pseudomallei 1258a]EIF53832.1 hypothetical protein BP1258B_5802 [Burkholderia pseudomallei 1258b]
MRRHRCRQPLPTNHASGLARRAGLAFPFPSVRNGAVSRSFFLVTVVSNCAINSTSHHLSRESGQS